MNWIDRGPLGLKADKAAKDEWRRLYGEDHEFTAMTQDAVRRMNND